MKLITNSIGLIAAALLLVLLAITRLFVGEVKGVELEIREIELAALPDPPPPLPDDPPPDVPPPPIALSEISPVEDPARVALPKVEVPVRMDMPVDPFFRDLVPAPLPSKPSPVASTTPEPKPRPRVERRPVSPPPPPVRKSTYQSSELDSKPRLIRAGSTTFPSSLARRGVDRGTVTLEVELSERGSVRVRRVISSTHPELVSGARRVASTSRFTAPKKDGQPVKAVMRWPIVIKKP